MKNKFEFYCSKINSNKSDILTGTRKALKKAKKESKRLFLHCDAAFFGQLKTATKSKKNAYGTYFRMKKRAFDAVCSQEL